MKVENQPVEPDYLYRLEIKNTMRYAYYKQKMDKLVKSCNIVGSYQKVQNIFLKKMKYIQIILQLIFYHHYQGDIALLGEMGF